MLVHDRNDDLERVPCRNLRLLGLGQRRPFVHMLVLEPEWGVIIPRRPVIGPE